MGPRRPSFLRNKTRSKSLNEAPRVLQQGNEEGKTPPREIEHKAISADGISRVVRSRSLTIDTTDNLNLVEAKKEVDPNSEQGSDIEIAPGHAEPGPLTSLSATASASLHQLIAPPLGARVLNVSEACEELWQCEAPEQAAMWLKQLHQAFLCTRLDAYEPSAAFVSLSGAALRFHGSLPSIHGDAARAPESFDVDTLWCVWEEALWASAALARVCVGAAWRSQIQRRRALIQGRAGIDELSGASPLDGASVSSSGAPGSRVTNINIAPRQTEDHSPIEEVTTGALKSSQRSFSPMTSSWFGASSRLDSFFPHIQERLPAAMLRFASSAVEAAFPSPSVIRGNENIQKWQQRRKSLAEAQRELVLALCYVTPEEEPLDVAGEGARPEWTILEAHGPIGIMVRFWFQACAPGFDTSNTHWISDVHLNWGLALQVTRAIADLLSAGWRPLWQGNIAEELVSFMLNMCRKGLALDPTSISVDIELDLDDNEEAVATSLGAVEAVSVLASIASSGLIPSTSQARVVQVLCDLLFSTDPVRLAGPDHGKESGNHSEPAGEAMHTLHSNRETCHADVVDLLWVLLAHDSSASTALDALLAMANPVCSWEAAVVDIRENNEIIQRASVAVRTLGGVLWGKHPENPGIPNLRIGWNSVLESLGEIADFVRYTSLRKVSFAPSENSNYLREHETCALFSLLLDVIASLRKFADSELLRPDALVLADEWKPFVRVFCEGVSFWLDCHSMRSSCQDMTIVEQIRSETESLVSRMGSFLTTCSSMEESSFHLIVDDGDLRDLYVCLLRDAVPRLESKNRTSLALAVIRSWANFGFMPHRSEEWIQTASAIVAETFSTYGKSPAEPSGDYVHAPLVRLEALVLITYDEDDRAASAVPDSTWLPAVSPLVLTRYVREQHTALVRAVLPAVLHLFSSEELSSIPDYPQVSLPIPAADQFYHVPTDQSTNEDELALLRFAVGLVGRLVRSVVGDRDHHSLLLGILQSVALQGLVAESDRESSANHALLISLEAIDQLELTLLAPFKALPQNHTSVPRIIQILCTVLQHREEPSDGVTVSGILRFAALLVLARLRMSHDARLLLINRGCVIQHVPESFASMLNGDIDDVDGGYLIAPFIHVNYVAGKYIQDRPASNRWPSTDSTPVSFELVSGAVVNALHISLTNSMENKVEKLGDLETRLRATCYDALSSFALSGLDIPFTSTLEIALLSSHASGDYGLVERLTRCRATSLLTQRWIVKEVDTDGLDSHDKDILRIHAIGSLIEELLQFCCSHIEQEVLAGCRAVGPLITPLSSSGCDENERDLLSHLTHRVIERLREEVMIKREDSDFDNASSLRGAEMLSLLYNIACHSDRTEYDKHNGVLVSVAEVCLEIIRSCTLRFSESCRSLAVRCLSTAVRQMYNDELDALLGADGSNPNQNVSIVRDIAAQRRLQLHAHSSVGDRIKIGRPCSSLHEKMSRESADITRFVPELEPKGGVPPKGAWLCGQGILTCRVGDCKSRYRGWLEVVYRSPTTRIRKIVRLPNSVALKNPEFPSSLWSGPGKTGRVPENSPQTVNNLYSSDVPVISKARAMILKWDNEFGPPNIPRTELDEVFYESALPLDNDASQPDSGETEQGRIRRWLLDILKGNRRFLPDIEQEFLNLGFSNESLGCISPDCGQPAPEKFRDYMLPIERLVNSPKASRAISILDRTSVLNTHKVALLFAGEPKRGVKSETTLEDVILNATGASPDFFEFSRALGSMVLTKHLKYFSGGLDSSGHNADGKFTFVYLDSADTDDHATTMIVFHSVALMPPGVNNRKRHVGNDNVHIIFVERGSRLHELIHGEGLDCDTLSSSLVSGQFGFVTIFVLAMPDPQLRRVSVRLREGLPKDSCTFLKQFVGDAMISRHVAADYVRDITIRADITCKAIMEDHFGPPNWEERRMQISAMERYCTQPTSPI